jgi:hypothetical protein
MVRVMTLTVPVINAALKTAIPVLTPLTPILGVAARQGDHCHREDDNSQKAKFEWCVHRIPFGMGCTSPISQPHVFASQEVACGLARAGKTMPVFGNSFPFLFRGTLL